MPNQQIHQPDNRHGLPPRHRLTQLSEEEMVLHKRLADAVRDATDDSGNIAAYAFVVFCAAIVASIFVANRLIPGMLW